MLGRAGWRWALNPAANWVLKWSLLVIPMTGYQHPAAINTDVSLQLKAVADVQCVMKNHVVLSC